MQYIYSRIIIFFLSFYVSFAHYFLLSLYLKILNFADMKDLIIKKEVVSY